MKPIIVVAIKNIIVISMLFVFTACGTIVTKSVPLVPNLSQLKPVQLPLSVALVVSKDNLRYTATGRDSIGISLGYVVTTLPNYYTKVLLSLFETVEVVKQGQAISDDDFDLIATFSTSKWHFNVPIQTYLKATVDISMSFSIETLNHEDIFSKTLSKTFKKPWSDLKLQGDWGFSDMSSYPLEEMFVALYEALSASEKIREIADQ